MCYMLVCRQEACLHSPSHPSDSYIALLLFLLLSFFLLSAVVFVTVFAMEWCSLDLPLHSAASRATISVITVIGGSFIHRSTKLSISTLPLVYISTPLVAKLSGVCEPGRCSFSPAATLTSQRGGGTWHHHSKHQQGDDRGAHLSFLLSGTSVSAYLSL